jgi:CBS domain containing-hemolysin-like protein
MGLALAVLFIVLNGFFVAAEFALVKVRAVQVHSRARAGERRAVWASTVVSRLDRYLSVTQFCITLASLGLGWVGEPTAEHLLEPLMRAVFPGSERAAVIAATVLGFGLLTYAHVLFGELVPKLLAVQRSEQVALFSALPLHALYLTFKPLLWGLEKASGVILRTMGLKPDATSEGTLSEEEIIGVMAANAALSPQGAAKAELVERVLRFSNRTARHAMVPRPDVAALPLSTSGEGALAYLRLHLYSRVIVMKERSLDEIAGYVYTKDFLSDPKARQAETLAPLVRDVLYVPETRSLIDVLRDMQKEQTPIAVVVDEYGGTSGIVTMEDLLEEIVGEIRDETDEEAPRVAPAADEPGAWDVDGRAKCEEVSAAVGVELGVEAGEPVGGIVLERLGRLPRKGDKVSLRDDLEAEVRKMDRRRVTLLRIRKIEPPPKSTTVPPKSASVIPRAPSSAPKPLEPPKGRLAPNDE